MVDRRCLAGSRRVIMSEVKAEVERIAASDKVIRAASDNLPRS
jgi:hypothetical protein